LLATPLLHRGGVAGIMRRWIMENAVSIGLRVEQRCIRSEDLMSAEEIFMSNAVVGIRSVSAIERNRAATLRISCMDAAGQLRMRLELL
jgi:branched-subunit amino acid aminotransferase/4-amino-4-deoxychorismate lyase